MINVTVPQNEDSALTPKIFVIGVGGAGGNAVTNMIRSNLEGVSFVVANTDAQALHGNPSDMKVQLGHETTQGLGAGSRPEVGKAAAEEALAEIMDHLEGANMVFITAGMGGGTGTGAGPVIAQACREAGILTVGVVTKPFQFEGAHRMRTAEAGIKELQAYVDTLIVIPNQNLFRLANEKTTFADAFKMADDVLHAGVRGVTDLMIMPGLINLDFADIKTVMQEMGKAMMGTGEASGERRATEAAEAAISNPLLEDTSMQGARGILINITGGMDMTLFEVDEAANRIRQEVDPDANIIFGSTFDEAMDGLMRVSVVATGIDVEAGAQPRPIETPVTKAVAKPVVEEKVEEVIEEEPAVAAALPEMDEDVVDPVPALDDMEPAAELGRDMDDPQVDLEDLTAPMAKPAAAAAPVAPPAAVAPPVAPAAMVPPSLLDQAAPKPVEEPAASARPLPERRDDAFIPPAPVDPGIKPEVARDAQPDPFAAAALANGGGNGQETRKRSLFDRVTGLGWSKDEQSNADQKVTEKAPQAPAAARPVSMPAAARPSLDRPAAAAPQPARPAGPARTAAAAAQPSLNIAPASPAESPEADEEMLDIPAFLRRQAN
ncbi:MAG: cell division protein FtsZ [Alphaproteobacteria bacterium]|nr:cell division protein FtsZ [Alphaproteobacteria bacterium SS10]